MLAFLSAASGSAAAVATSKQSRSKPLLPNGGFKTADDGRLIISDKALRGQKDDAIDDGSDSDDSSADSGHDPGSGNPKRGMEEDSSDEEDLQKATSAKRKRQATDALSMRSGKTNASTHKGIHRSLNAAATDAMSVKSSGGHSKIAGSEYSSKKAKGDMKQRGKLDPYAYIPLTRNTLNKRLVTGQQTDQILT